MLVGLSVCLALWVGCDTAAPVGTPAAGRPGAPPPPAPPGEEMAASLIELPLEPVTVIESSPAAASLSPANIPPAPAPAAPTFFGGGDEGQVRALFAELLAAAAVADGRRLLACYPPAEHEALIRRTATVIVSTERAVAEMDRMAAGEFRPPGADAAQRGFAEASAMAQQTQAMIEAVRSSAAEKEQLLSRAATAIRQWTGESRSELVNLSIEGNEATGVHLMVTYAGTGSSAFAARKVDGRWTAVVASPAADAKVEAYKKNPQPAATVKLPPRPQVRISADDLVREFQADQVAAGRKYSPGPGRNEEYLLEGTVAYRQPTGFGSIVYLLTPVGSPPISVSPQKKAEIDEQLVQAQAGQTIVATIGSVRWLQSPQGAEGTIGVSPLRVELRGQPAEPTEPLSVREFQRQTSDAAAAVRLRAQPVTLHGNAAFSRPQQMLVGVTDGMQTVLCFLDESQRKRLQGVKPGEVVRIQGTFAPQPGTNQTLLRFCVFVDG